MKRTQAQKSTTLRSDVWQLRSPWTSNFWFASSKPADQPGCGEEHLQWKQEIKKHCRSVVPSLLCLTVLSGELRYPFINTTHHVPHLQGYKSVTERPWNIRKVNGKHEMWCYRVKSRLHTEIKLHLWTVWTQRSKMISNLNFGLKDYGVSGGVRTARPKHSLIKLNFSRLTPQ